MSHLSQPSMRWAAVTVATLCGHALACDGPATVDHMLGEADLVFRGTVERIDHRLSTSAGAADGNRGMLIPHTFVTYRIDEMVAGDYANQTLTLRFVGGPDPRSGRILWASIVPRFDLGDEDVLFVLGNGASQSPLVHSTEGRLRVIDEQVYSETGRAITLDDAGTIVPGRRHALDAVRFTTVGEEVHEMVPGPDVVDGPSDAIDVATLMRALAAGVTRVAPRPAVVVADLDPDARFAAPDLAAKAPPADPEGAAEGAAGPSEPHAPQKR